MNGGASTGMTRSDRARLAPAALVLAALVGHAWLHVAAAMTLPVPWPDELHFALPSIALLDHGDFHSPALHAERPLMWMPLGYAVLMTPVYALFGPSLVAARTISWLAISMSAVLLWRLTAGAGRPWAGAIAAAAFALHPAVVASGNVARMDAAVLLMALLGVWLMARRIAWPGFAVLCAAPLVHPNGLYYCLVGLGALVIVRPKRPRRREAALLVAVALAWLGYTAHVLAHWDGFVADMGFQLARKGGRDLMATLAGQHTLRLVVLLALLAEAGRRRRWSWLAAVAIPSWVLARVGHEMWYEPFDAVVGAALIVVSVDAALSWASTRSSKHAGRVGLAIVVAAIGWLLRADRPHLPNALQWKGMGVRQSPYVKAGERLAVDQAIAQLAATRIEVFPRGDALLLLQGLGDRLVDPVRSGATGSVRIVHESPAHPKRWRERATAFLARAPQPVLLHRDRDTAWWAVPVVAGN
ncbi:MAG: hypothetical protein AAF721_03400 [Myxococcota bacterium]